MESKEIVAIASIADNTTTVHVKKLIVELRRHNLPEKEVQANVRAFWRRYNYNKPL